MSDSAKMQDVLETKARPHFDKSFCEFFAGIGLVREGLERDGWRCIYANDIDPKKLTTYRERFGGGDVHECDIHETEEVVNQITETPFLATASFPCVDLSLAGHYRGFDGKYSSTFFGFTDAIQRLVPDQPRVVMLENVLGFLTAHQGRDFRSAMSALSDLGYWLDCVVVNASHFTPQSRPRVFVIGVSEELSERVRRKPSLFSSYTPEVDELRPKNVIRRIADTPLSTGWIQLHFPPLPKRARELREVIDLDDDQEWWGEDEVSRHYEMMSDLHRQKVDQKLIDGKTWTGTIFRRVRQGKTRAEVRFDGVAGCLRTPKGGSAKQIVVAVLNGELRMRWMSPVEYARLQGVDEFPLVGTRIQQLWGFADAVCVPAIQWIAQNALTPIHAASLSK